MNGRFERLVQTNGIGLHVVQAGPETGPLVILLHGFPEFWYGWRHQIDALAGAGYRVWAVDQRGYNQSDKPDGIAAYNLDILARDVLGLIDAAGRARAALVGHDWGAAVAWWVATKHPERLDRLMILNVPHPEVMWRMIVRKPGQWLRSAYIGFFQIPTLPELTLRARNWNAAAQMLLKTSHTGAFTAADLARYRTAWAQPGALTCMLNWYRAIVQKPPRRVRNPRISIPTLMLWGVRDTALSRNLAPPSIDLCDRGELVFFENATHWLQHEEPERVNQSIIAFLATSHG